MLEDQKKIMTEVWEEELRRIEAEKATLKDQVHMHGCICIEIKDSE